MTRLGRRALLAGAGAGAVGLALAGGTRAWRAARRSSARARLNARFVFPAGAAAIGRAYLAAFPAERPARFVDDLLLPEVDFAALAARMRADLREGRVVQVAGFTLSRTEARLYALSGLAVDFGALVGAQVD